MISGRKSTRKVWNSKIVSFACAIFILSVILLPARTHAQDGIKLYQRQVSVGGRLPATMLIVGLQKDAKDVEKLMDIVSSKATEAYMRLDWQNPSSDISRLNAGASQGPVQVSEEVAHAIAEAKEVSGWTDGAFDITYAGSGNWRDINVNEGNSSIELKKPGMQLRFDNMMEGFLAELMIRYINTANMHNAMVKVGNVFRGMGQSIGGPWKIQVQDDEGTFAHHALNLTVRNAGIAAVSASDFRAKSLIDPRSKSTITPSCKGTTIVMKNAAQAHGVAQAVFVLGPKKGYEMLTKMGKAAGLIVDDAGKFIRTPGF
ncbi:MAG: FAD:protein FMN transferase [Pseudomonadota bacterium]